MQSCLLLMVSRADTSTQDQLLSACCVCNLHATPCLPHTMRQYIHAQKLPNLQSLLLVLEQCHF